jgi:cytoskeleton protein RodZ
MSALGDTFRAARESQGLTLSDVAERIHIRSVYLAAIEAEDWTAIGPPVYIRGFVRTYARCLGLDPDAAVARFSDRALGGELPSAPFQAAGRIERKPARSERNAARPERTMATGERSVRRGERAVASGPRAAERKPGLSIGAFAGVFVALALVVFVGFQYFDYQRGASGVAKAARSIATAPPASQPEGPGRELQRRAEPGVEARATPKTEERSGFAIRLRDGSWLRVVVDGKVVMEGLYPKGTARTFAGRSATVRVGNAGGVDVSVDGKDLGPMGGLGDVAERSFQL